MSLQHKKLIILNWYLTAIHSPTLNFHIAIKVQFRINSNKLQIKALTSHWDNKLGTDFNIDSVTTVQPGEEWNFPGAVPPDVKGYGAKDIIVFYE